MEPATPRLHLHRNRFATGVTVLVAFFGMLATAGPSRAADPLLRDAKLRRDMAGRMRFFGEAETASPVLGHRKSDVDLARKLEAIADWNSGRADDGLAENLGGRKGVAAVAECPDCVRGAIPCDSRSDGDLGTGDCRLSDGSYVETWSFKLTASEHVEIGLESADVDAFLFLTDRNCLVIAHNDDCEPDVVGNACLALDLPPGDYYLAANSVESPSVGSYTLRFTCGNGGPAFLRGDCNGNGSTQGVADAITMLTVNFLGGIEIPCRAACDVNGDGNTRGVNDAIALLTANFLGGVVIPAPYPTCGKSELPSDEALDCAEPPTNCP